MKLLSVETPQGSRLAAHTPAGVLVFSRIPGSQLPLTLQDALTVPGGIERILPVLSAAIADPKSREYMLPEEQIEIAVPFTPRNIVCVGRNYKAHAEEGGDPVPERPMLFAKLATCVIGAGKAIVTPPDTTQLDYEGELAVVIGRRCRGVTAADALRYVAGYSCFNDVSARDFQAADNQWTRGKSQDTFGPFGPYLVTADEVNDPQKLSIRTYLGNRAVQDSNTSRMIFPVRELIAYISRGITLDAGDVISTGTPEGCGFAQKPPYYLKPGDVVRVEIEGLGCLENPVA